MNLRIYYKNFSSRIASKWIVLLVDACLVFISMVLACVLQNEISSVTYDKSLYVSIFSFSLFSNICFFWLIRTCDGVIRYSSFVDVYRIFISLTMSYGMIGLGNFCWASFGLGAALPSSIVLMAYILNFIFMMCLRILVKMVHEVLSFDSRHSINVFIFGFHGTGVNIAKSLRVCRNNHYKLCGFISDEPSMIGKHTMGCRVYPNDSLLFKRLKKKDIHTIIVAPGKLPDLEATGVMEQLLSHHINVMTIPPLSDCLDDGEIKNIHIEDWLRWEPAQVDIRKIASYVEGRRILVTGAAGAVGKGMVRQLASLNPYQLILVDQAETPLYDVQLELSDHWKNIEVRVHVADVTNHSRMKAIFEQYMPQIVFHAAAYNDILLLEDYASEAIQTNLSGTMNVVDLSVECGVEKCMVISSKQALHPSHVMGASKCLAEIYLQALAQKMQNEICLTKMLIVRLGDIYPSSSRSLLTMPEACQLILEAGSMGGQGEVFVFDEESAWVTTPTAHARIMISTESLYDYKQVSAVLSSLVQKSVAEESLEIANDLKKTVADFVNSYSAPKIEM